MVSRDTRAHVVALLIAVVVLVVLSELVVLPETEFVTVSFLLLFYGLVLGGAHAYLALRGYNGLVSVEARLRYLAMLAILLVTGGLIFLAGTETIFGMELGTIGFAIIVVTVIGYLVGESLDAYRESREEA